MDYEAATTESYNSEAFDTDTDTIFDADFSDILNADLIISERKLYRYIAIEFPCFCNNCYKVVLLEK